MAETKIKPQRPLSPHLQVYKPQISSVLSILHRATGVFLSIGSLVLAVWLYAAAYSPDCFADMQSFFGNVFGQMLLVGWSGAFYYHLCNGVRHLFWDMGKGFSIPAMTKSGYAVLGAAAIMTLVSWVSVWS